MFNPEKIKSTFPIFQVHPELIYFDNAATTQRPASVIENMNDFYQNQNANIHRGVYTLSANATLRYENARKSVADFIGAVSDKSIAFTKGTTESINIVARSYLAPLLKPKNNVVITAMEHHANLIPWQQLCIQKKAELRVIPINKDGDLDITQLNSLIDVNTRLLAFTHISNSIGTINPVKALIEHAHKKKVPVLLDAAQSAAFYKINVTRLNVDFMVFSGHKMFGPFGVGILYAHPRVYDKILPYNFGGGMVKMVDFDKTIFQDYPYSLDAGTMQIADILGLNAAINYLNEFNRLTALDHILQLNKYARAKLKEINQVEIIGNAKNLSTITSFNLKGIHAHDVATFLGEDNIAVRAGHHCNQPMLKILNQQATVRISLTHYNSKAEIDNLTDSLKRIIKFWS